MNVNGETNYREPYNELVNEALKDINTYKESRNLDYLKLAVDKLGQARAEDPKDKSALFFSGVVYDLIGMPKDAVKQFERMLQEDPSRRTEIEYNLAIACYHQYSHGWLKKADEHFNAVLHNTSNLILQLLAHAGLAQT